MNRRSHLPPALGLGLLVLLLASCAPPPAAATTTQISITPTDTHHPGQLQRRRRFQPRPPA
jgi:hypothetical protein